MTQLMTPYQKRIAKRNEAIYAEYKKVIANPKNSMMAFYTKMMKKHRIDSRTTVWDICKKMKAMEEA